MQQTLPPCARCGAFTRRSLLHEQEYQSSVLLERLRTSDVPATDEEISHVRHTILPIISDDISSIESKISSLREVIWSMQEEREELINVHTRYYNLVSLHRALPSEIWSKIFLYTLSSDSDPNAFDASGPIWRLSHVCQKWRNIALSLHSFWSTMCVSFSKALQEGDVQCLETIMHRSCQGPLDVSLYSDYSRAPSADPSILQRIFDILVAESYRWQKLYLSDDGGRLNMLYAPLYNRLPRLESLSLDRVQIELKERTVFKDCPRLTKLTLSGSPPVVEFPWDQITELDLYHIDFHGGEEGFRACMRIVGLCTALEILSLPYRMDGWYLQDDEAVSPYPPITCSNVRKLDTRSVRVLDALTLPRLQEASFHPESTSSQHDALYVFGKLLIRSNALSTLTSLSLGIMRLAASPHHALHSILSETRNLTFLSLNISLPAFDSHEAVSDWEQIKMIVESLEIIPTRAVTFLPLLSSLDIQLHNFRGSSHLHYFEPVHSLALMLKMRWQGDDTLGLARLRRCHFVLQTWDIGMFGNDVDAERPVFNEEEHCIFDALINEGMDLSISFYKGDVGFH